MTEATPSPVYWLRCAAVSVGAGALVGLLDCVVAHLAEESVLIPSAWLAAVVVHAILWLPPGLLLALLHRRLLRRSAGRSAGVPVLLLSVLFLALGLLNHHFLEGPVLGFSRVGWSLLTAALVGGLFLLVRGRGAAGGLRWAGIGVACAAVAAAAPWVLGPAGREGDAPEVTTAPGSRPSVLVLLVDALRADHLSLHGYERPTSRNLDRFAEGAVVFETARVESNWTKPSTASLFTGLPPLVHGSLRFRDCLPRGVTTLAECMRAAGYETAAFSANPYVSPMFGMEQGFDRFLARKGWGLSPFQNGTLLGFLFRRAGLPDPVALVEGFAPPGDLVAEELNRELLGWLDEIPPDRPWFGYVHYMEPHEPYWAPDPFRLRYADPAYPTPDVHPPLENQRNRPWSTADPLPDEEREFLVDLYDAEIAYWDHCFEKLLEALRSRGRLEDTVVVVLSDHGEEFYEHGGWTHKQCLFEELLHVPLIIRAPGVAPARVPQAVTATGIYSTILDLAGLEVGGTPRFPPPTALLPLPEADRVHFASHVAGEGMLSSTMIRGRFKWILSRRPGEEIMQCFDLSTDPRELQDLAGARPVDATAVRSVMDRIAAYRKEASFRAGKAATTEEMRKDLRGLGYVR